MKTLAPAIDLATAPAMPPAARISWRSWPLVEDRRRSAALLLTIAAFSLGIGVSFESAAWGAFSLAVLALFLAPYLAPTDFALSPEGAEARLLGRATRLPWSRVRALYRHRDAVHLSPFAAPSRLDPFRGLTLRFRANGPEVTAFCERHAR